MMYLLCLLLPLIPVGSEEGWIQLFNGTDMSGWKANVAPDSFSVVDGTIRAHCTSTKVRAHLFYIGNGGNEFRRFKDFELRAVIRGEPNSNSGIFFHTDFSTRDKKLHLGKGYEVQLNSAQREKRKTGSLYAIADVLEAPIDDTKWFELHLIVKDKSIIVNLDGKQVIDYLEPENPERPPNRSGRLLDPMGGAIAIQAHDPDSIWYFKEIWIKPLQID